MWLHRIAENFSQSAHELRRTRSLAACALLLALQVILGMCSIPLSPSLQIAFDYLPLCLTAIFFGPAAALLTGGLSDLIAFLIRPTGPFMPGFTLSAALSGLIYGLCFYRREPLGLRRYALARLIVVVVCNIVLNTLWLYLAYGGGVIAWIPGRIIKNIAEYPVSLCLLCAFSKVLPKIRSILHLH